MYDPKLLLRPSMSQYFAQMYSFDSVVDKIDFSRSPVQPWDVLLLGRTLKAFEKDWNIRYNEYKVSGENDKDFAVYLGRKGVDLHGLPGKSLLIPAFICVIDTGFNDTLCLELTSRLVNIYQIYDSDADYAHPSDRVSVYTRNDEFEENGSRQKSRD